MAAPLITGSLGILAAAMIVFVLSHMLLSSKPLRTPLVHVVGEVAFLGIYSAVALAVLTWVIRAYNAAPVEVLWIPPVALRHLSLSIMPVACVLVIAGLTTPSPTAVSLDPQAILTRTPTGIQKVTRHPVLWGIMLWSVVHTLANGDAASLILFSGFTVLSLLGALHIDARKRAVWGQAWDAYARTASFVPFFALLKGQTHLRVGEIGWWRIGLGLAVYAGLIIAHPWLFGVDVWPL